MSQRSTDIAHRDLVVSARPARRRWRRTRIAKDDLLPIMVLFGTVYGWVLLTVAIVVAVILLLVG